MFILRKYNDNAEVNFDLGESYNVIRKDSNEKKFKEFEPVPENTRIVITGQIGGVYMVLKDENCYIMTGGGQTFARINPK